MHALPHTCVTVSHLFQAAAKIQKMRKIFLVPSSHTNTFTFLLSKAELRLLLLARNCGIVRKPRRSTSQYEMRIKADDNNYIYCSFVPPIKCSLHFSISD